MAATDGGVELFGDIETVTRAAVAELGGLNGIQGPLAEIAYELARKLDNGVVDTALPGTAKELRETLTTIKEASDAGDAASELEAFMSSAVDDAAH